MKAVNAYLNFNGNCREAMSFYAKCLGAKLDLMTFGDAPGPDGKPAPKEMKDRIMHARVSSGPVQLMASDTMPGTPFQQGNNFSIALECDSPQEVDKLFAALSEKGRVTMPVQETFWATRFGMLTDQFGIAWMFNLSKPQ
jgi:PhnB protein